LHAFDAVLSLASPNQTGALLKLYPFYNTLLSTLGRIDAPTYFWASLLSTFFLFGITSSIAFHDPVMNYIKRVVSEAKPEDSRADPNVESELNTLTMINDSLTSSTIALRELKSDVNTLQDGVTSVKVDMTKLWARIGVLETDLAKMRKCPGCGKSVLPDFKLCPYCGEELSLYVLVRKEVPTPAPAPARASAQTPTPASASTPTPSSAPAQSTQTGEVLSHS